MADLMPLLALLDFSQAFPSTAHDYMHAGVRGKGAGDFLRELGADAVPDGLAGGPPDAEAKALRRLGDDVEMHVRQHEHQRPRLVCEQGLPGQCPLVCSIPCERGFK